MDLAIEEFERAVDADKKNPYFRKGLGQAYAGRGDFKDAIKQFREALELNPFSVEAHKLRIETLLDLRQIPRALKALEEADGEIGDDPRIYLNELLEVVLFSLLYHY